MTKHYLRTGYEFYYDAHFMSEEHVIELSNLQCFISLEKYKPHPGARGAPKGVSLEALELYLPGPFGKVTITTTPPPTDPNGKVLYVITGTLYDTDCLKRSALPTYTGLPPMVISTEDELESKSVSGIALLGLLCEMVNSYEESVLQASAAWSGIHVGIVGHIVPVLTNLWKTPLSTSAVSDDAVSCVNPEALQAIRIEEKLLFKCVEDAIGQLGQ